MNECAYTHRIRKTEYVPTHKRRLTALLFHYVVSNCRTVESENTIKAFLGTGHRIHQCMYNKPIMFPLAWALWISPRINITIEIHEVRILGSTTCISMWKESKLNRYLNLKDFLKGIVPTGCNATSSWEHCVLILNKAGILKSEQRLQQHISVYCNFETF